MQNFRLVRQDMYIKHTQASAIKLTATEYSLYFRIRKRNVVMKCLNINLHHVPSKQTMIFRSPFNWTSCGKWAIFQKATWSPSYFMATARQRPLHEFELREPIPSFVCIFWNFITPHRGSLNNLWKYRKWVCSSLLRFPSFRRNSWGQQYVDVTSSWNELSIGLHTRDTSCELFPTLIFYAVAHTFCCLAWLSCTTSWFHFVLWVFDCTSKITACSLKAWNSDRLIS